MLKQLSLLFILCVFSAHLQAQQPQKPTASEVHESIKKLNVLASVLYVAAHPDDENTRLISYLANHIKPQTTYLSITCGDGGQNLIGDVLSTPGKGRVYTHYFFMYQGRLIRGD